MAEHPHKTTTVLWKDRNVKVMAEDAAYEFKDLKPIGKRAVYAGCKIKVIPKPRHPPMEIKYKPPWDNSPPSPREVVIMRPKDSGRHCEDKTHQSQTPGYHIVNGWQVKVSEPVPESQESCPSIGDNDGGSVLCKWSHEPSPGSTRPCEYRRSTRDR